MIIGDLMQHFAEQEGTRKLFREFSLEIKRLGD